MARGAALTALDSSEGPGWSTNKLVDGLTRVSFSKRVPLPTTMLRKPFALDQQVRRAVAYITALGLYELRINGNRVGDHLLAPEWTSYHKRIQYQAHDVTYLLKEGANVIGATLGAGWYAGKIGLRPVRAVYGSRPRLLLRLDIELADGETKTIVSDGSWRMNDDGPIRSSDIYDGETYDARKEIPGWDGAEPSDFDDQGWRAVAVGEDPGQARLVWQPNEPIRVIQELEPMKRTEPKSGVYLYDLGQNMVGWTRIRMKGKAGTTVMIRHGEMLNEDGSLYTTNLRNAYQTDRYTLRGGEEEVFEPHFTYHGFRYVEVTGIDHPPVELMGRVFHSSAPDAGRFESSSERINKLMKAVLWTQRGNLHGIPTDCPQRSERLGWAGDFQIFSQTASFHMNMAAFFGKWVRDMGDDQTADGRYPDYAPSALSALGVERFHGVPGWADAVPIILWRAYVNYQDERLLEEQFDAASRWVDYMAQNNPRFLWKENRANDYGDWLSADTFIQEGWPETGGSTPKEVFATAYFAHSAQLLSKMADVLGKAEKAEFYQDLFKKIKSAFQEAYVDSNGRIEGETQGAYALALRFDLLPKQIRSKAARHMVDGFKRYHGHLSTGIQLTHRVMLELTRNGYNDEAYRLLNLRSFPSWGFMLDNGATTIWERWDGYVRGRGFQDPNMNSFNHWALGAVGEWVWRHVVGINPDPEKPAYRHFVVRPRPGGGLTWAKGEYDSIRGPIVSDWKLSEGTITLQVRVPPNTTATIWVPTSDLDSVRESGRLAADGEAITFVGSDPEAAAYRVGSGQYTFTAVR